MTFRLAKPLALGLMLAIPFNECPRMSIPMAGCRPIRRQLLQSNELSGSQVCLFGRQALAEMGLPFRLKLHSHPHNAPRLGRLFRAARWMVPREESGRPGWGAIRQLIRRSLALATSIFHVSSERVAVSGIAASAWLALGQTSRLPSDLQQPTRIVIGVVTFCFLIWIFQASAAAYSAIGPLRPMRSGIGEGPPNPEGTRIFSVTNEGAFGDKKGAIVEKLTDASRQSDTAVRWAIFDLIVENIANLPILREIAAEAASVHAANRPTERPWRATVALALSDAGLDEARTRFLLNATLAQIERLYTAKIGREFARIQARDLFFSLQTIREKPTLPASFRDLSAALAQAGRPEFGAVGVVVVLRQKLRSWELLAAVAREPVIKPPKPATPPPPTFIIENALPPAKTAAEKQAHKKDIAEAIRKTKDTNRALRAAALDAFNSMVRAGFQIPREVLIALAGVNLRGFPACELSGRFYDYLLSKEHRRQFPDMQLAFNHLYDDECHFRSKLYALTRNGVLITAETRDLIDSQKDTILVILLNPSQAILSPDKPGGRKQPDGSRRMQDSA